MTQDPKKLIPKGWTQLDVKSHYSQSIGPLYMRRKPVGLGFVVEPSHTNLNGVVHGGALATLADLSLFLIAANGDDKMNGATLSLNINYLSPGKVGHFIHCEGRIVREGSSVIFVEGSAFDGHDELITFNGVIKRFRARSD